MKKGLIIFLIVIFVILGGFVGFYCWGLSPKAKEADKVTFVIEAGTSKTLVAKNLEKAGLIRSQYPLILYLFLNRNNIQAGEYELSASMKPEDMIDKFSRGDVKINSVTITFVEGKNMKDYANIVADSFDITADEFVSVANDKAFLQSLIDSGDYWFLQKDILTEDIYYPLEGYLYPDTYEFLETADAKTVIITLLNHTKVKLDGYREQMEANELSVHELLTLASIVEKEAITANDRKMASQVFLSRLKDNWSLGSDVTAYYGVGKDMTEVITSAELNDHNPYNTRLTDGSMNGKLPIGPICNPDITSIEAVLNPSDTNYYFFVANVCTGEVFFQTTSTEFEQKVRELHGVCEAN